MNQGYLSNLSRISWAAAALLAIQPIPAGEAAPERPLVFTDITAAAGIDFIETIGDDDLTNIVEATGVGCGFLDYDGDGRLDIYLVNGCWKEGISDSTLDPGRRRELAAATDRLYRNRGDGTFEDVTARAGVARPGYGMAVVAADYDGDGDADLYVTNHGPNFLYRNNGDGTFTDVGREAGVDDPLFGVGAVFFDYNRDGRLDLYAGNYLTYDPSITPEHAQNIVRSPLAYDGQNDRLFRGKADGTFEDVTSPAGILRKPAGRAMGVGALDYQGDGLLDVFVSNDAMENFLWENRGDGTFRNQALLAGLAYSESGAAAAAMAVEVGDFDGDGLVDILVPDMNLCCLYRNLGGGMFEDVAVRSGLAVKRHLYHSWGGVLADFNLDGILDAFISNGNAGKLEAQEDQFFLGAGKGRFRFTRALAGAEGEKKFVSRGAARGDIDNDGDLDLLVNNLNGRPRLLRNDTPRRGCHWLGVTLIGRGGNRDAIGATVRITAGPLSLIQPRLPAGSYLSQHDHRLHFGLGRQARADRIEITWPGGERQTLKNVPADQWLSVRQPAAGPEDGK